MISRRATVAATLVLSLLPFYCAAQDQNDDWPPLSYLKADYKSVAVVAHVLIRHAEISGQIPGYENWRITAEVLEPFKGKLSKGDLIEYFHGAEAGVKKEYFTGEKIVFLLTDHDNEQKALKYSVLENSTLTPAEQVLRKLRIIRKSVVKRRHRR